ncbi:MAG: PTS sugar transporter subunit IIA [Actinobacteria bacterium]|jgi:PTS system ascorbate-specific IIA component|uniref:Ascorbate-specific PTS system EIIA component n=1 Tax=freshwater metagenome TaxID=449393 RepID=A0A6J6I9G0_9ZZZZ|nr:PTS sugar transporter subunit IIA [Actinomycetota bacterium]
MSFPKLQEAFGSNSIRVGAIALDREHAIELAGELLVSSGRVTPEYTAEMVDVLESHGPYFVLAPGIAIAHSKPSDAVISTGLSLLTLAEPIPFGNTANDPVRLVLGMSAIDHNTHIEMLAELSALLGDVRTVNSLLNATDTEQIRALL